MNKKLWEASEKTKNNSNLFRYENFIAKNYNYKISKKNYSKILNWTIKKSKDFWSSLWDFAKIKQIVIENKKYIFRANEFFHDR